MDTYQATRTARVAMVGGAALLLLALVPHIGWTPVVLSGVIGSMLALTDVLVRRVRLAEWVLAISYLLSGSVIATGILATGGVRSPIIAMQALPLLLLANRFRPTVTFAGLGVGMALLVAAAVAPEPHAVVDNPTPLVFTAVLMVNIIALTLPQYDTEGGLRTSTHIDALTGLLNRHGLEQRFADVCAAGAATGCDTPVSLIVFDLDSFKRINDRMGHNVGDEVLRAAAAVLTGRGRSDDQIYRLGGEEIGVLLPGLDLAAAVEVAERHRAAIAAEPLAGVNVTVSGGVASRRAADASWLDLYRAADHALLRAKAGGRNRVEAERASATTTIAPVRARSERS